MLARSTGSASASAAAGTAGLVARFKVAAFAMGLDLPQGPAGAPLLATIAAISPGWNCAGEASRRGRNPLGLGPACLTPLPARGDPTEITNRVPQGPKAPHVRPQNLDRRAPHRRGRVPGARH